MANALANITNLEGWKNWKSGKNPPRAFLSISLIERAAYSVEQLRPNSAAPQQRAQSPFFSLVLFTASHALLLSHSVPQADSHHASVRAPSPALWAAGWQSYPA
jgi:hypothetical protein